jgi:hypothetical protein
MRCLMIVKASAQSETGVMPRRKTEQMFADMGAFNDEMKKAGVLVDGTGLTPSSRGARVQFDKNGTPTVTRGPFGGDPTNLISGFWVIDVASLDEAISWAKRIPQSNGAGPANIEIRPYYTEEDIAAALAAGA